MSGGIGVGGKAEVGSDGEVRPVRSAQRYQVQLRMAGRGCWVGGIERRILDGPAAVAIGDLNAQAVGSIRFKGSGV